MSCKTNTISNPNDVPPARVKTMTSSRIFFGAACCVSFVLFIGRVPGQVPPAAASSPELVGLLDFAPIYEQSVAQRLEAFVRPSPTAQHLAEIDGRGIRLFDTQTYSCVWIRDIDANQAPSGCTFTESNYEVPSIAVFEADGNWYRLVIDAKNQQYGWVQSNAGYHPLVELLSSDERLTHFTSVWDGKVYQLASESSPLVVNMKEGAKSTRPAAQGTPYRVRSNVLIKGQLWLNVEILDEVCGEAEPRVLYTGWVPARSPTGVLWAWFDSRGC